jgi:hypothetical protein
MSNSFFKLIKHPIKFRLFLLSKLPSAYFSGVQVAAIDESHCKVTVPYKWFSTNPFKSTYFACLSMAAEMSTGVLALAHIHNRKPSVSMLVQKIEANFLKKAADKTTFTCNDGLAIQQTILDAIATGEGKTITAKSVGVNVANEVVAEFFVTWSFKVKKSN